MISRLNQSLPKSNSKVTSVAASFFDAFYRLARLNSGGCLLSSSLRKSRNGSNGLRVGSLATSREFQCRGYKRNRRSMQQKTSTSNTSSTTQASEIRDGDWRCSNCGVINFANRISCFNCFSPIENPKRYRVSKFYPLPTELAPIFEIHQKRNQTLLKTRVATVVTTDPDFKKKEYLEVPNTQNSDQSNVHTQKSNCSAQKHHKPKSKPKYQRYSAVDSLLPSHFKVDTNTHTKSLKTGDWICPKCTVLNHARQLACFKCGFDGQTGTIDRILLPDGRQSGIRDEDTSIVSGDRKNPKTDADTSYHPQSTPNYHLSATHSNDSLLETTCTHTPSTPMDPTISLNPLEASPSVSPSSSDGPSSFSSLSQNTVPSDYYTSFRDGDWICSTCIVHNYGSRDTCRACGSIGPTWVLEQIEAKAEAEAESVNVVEVVNGDSPGERIEKDK
ncbi:hypothetical protein BKA69DRAFT_1167992 [Paraphysoderma sedebokerense]|nr:hypothetical protein BKA69DRAFT_1167992 [Paraphysoderma sedebokerense]